MELILLFILLPLTQTANHSLSYFITTSSGLQTFPEFVAVSKVDGVNVGYCDSKVKTAEPRQDWVKKIIEDDPQHREWHTQYCISAHQIEKALIEKLNQHFNQVEGVHTFQEMSGCILDDETGEVKGYEQYSYDGEDFISLDLKAGTWLYSKRADTYKHSWDSDNYPSCLENDNKILTHICPQWLKKYLDYGKSSLQRTVLPSVSLLQKTPSSPVSCHATGFYPDRAEMFWRKDGEEIHEDVDHGKILPNNDGTFQMSVDLNILSVGPEDWKRYDCVFQLSGVDTKFVTGLDKAVIRTNLVRPSEFPVGAVSGVVVGLLLLAVCITGLFMWRENKNGPLYYITTHRPPVRCSPVPVSHHVPA